MIIGSIQTADSYAFSVRFFFFIPFSPMLLLKEDQSVYSEWMLMAHTFMWDTLKSLKGCSWECSLFPDVCLLVYLTLLAGIISIPLLLLKRKQVYFNILKCWLKWELSNLFASRMGSLLWAANHHKVNESLCPAHASLSTLYVARRALSLPHKLGKVISPSCGISEALTGGRFSSCSL